MAKRERCEVLACVETADAARRQVERRLVVSDRGEVGAAGEACLRILGAWWRRRQGSADLDAFRHGQPWRRCREAARRCAGLRPVAAGCCGCQETSMAWLRGGYDCVRRSVPASDFDASPSPALSGEHFSAADRPGIRSACALQPAVSMGAAAGPAGSRQHAFFCHPKVHFFNDEAP